MGLQSKSDASMNKGQSNRATGGAKKKSSKNKSKKMETKVPQKVEAKLTQKVRFARFQFSGAENFFFIVFGMRLFSALFGTINDCDETYNYWEPAHYLLYGKGFQTWEYSPEYALRSYTYLLLHVAPMWIYNKFIEQCRMCIFFSIRVGLGVLCTFCEFYFYMAVKSEFGFGVANVMLGFLMFSPGMFIAGTAFLPSSFAMYMCFLSIGAWIKKKYELAIFCVALSTYIGWPFAAMLGAPIALDMLIIKKYYKKFFQWSIISTVVILVPLVKMDSDFYGKLVIAPLNIVKYNIFSNRGPNLYGQEPICFYLINGFLNFNVAFVAAILAPSCLLLRNFVLTQAKRKGEYFTSWLILSPFYIWFVVFTLQPHKEERFLFPVYPLIALCGAHCIYSLQIIYSLHLARPLGKACARLRSSDIVCVLAVSIAALLGFSRILLFLMGYYAPFAVWFEMHKLTYIDKAIDPNAPINVCYGKEWHRFPSNFLVPSPKWSVRFIESDFKGQLPAEYSPLENGTAIVHPHFNDMNREEPSRYFDVEKCDFLIDCDYGKTSKLEPNYTSQTDKWSVVLSFPFLNAEQSTVLYRSLYIPFTPARHHTYSKYYLLRSTKFHMKKGKEKD